MRTISLIISIIFILFTGSSVVFANTAPTVFVSILPQKYFVQQIGMDRINVEVMVQPGASPATYEPKASQMRQLSEAKAYFAIGVPFENAWLDRISGVNKNMKIVHTDAGIEKLAMAEHSHDEPNADHKTDHESEHGHDEDHDAEQKAGHDSEHGHDEDHKAEQEAGHDSEHGHGEDHKGEQEADHDSKDAHDEEAAGDHDHGSGLDPHIWLSPTLVKKQAQTIAAALAELYPSDRDFFQKNLKTFLDRVDELNTQLHRALKDKKGIEFMVFHPSWGYFAEEFGMHQIAIEIEGKNPKPAQLRELIEHARERDIHVIFAQPQFSTKSAQVIAREIGGEVVMIDPLAEDWMTNMQDVVDTFIRTL